jgi:hypothetical protein
VPCFSYISLTWQLCNFFSFGNAFEIPGLWYLIFYNPDSELLCIFKSAFLWFVYLLSSCSLKRKPRNGRISSHRSLGVSGLSFQVELEVRKSCKGVEKDTVLKLPLQCRATVFYSHIKAALTGMCGILTL